MHILNLDVALKRLNGGESEYKFFNFVNKNMIKNYFIKFLSVFNFMDNLKK